jgi:hypothetical protein
VLYGGKQHTLPMKPGAVKAALLAISSCILAAGCALQPARVQSIGGGKYMATATDVAWNDAKVKAIDAANAYCAKSGGANILDFEPSSDPGMNRTSAIFTCNSPPVQ